MSQIDLADSLIIKPDGTNGGDTITGNGDVHIFRSAIQTLNAGNDALRVVVEYEAIDENVNSSYFLTAIVETKDSQASRWTPLIRQNNPLNDLGQNVKIFEINKGIFDQTFGGTLDQGNVQYQFRQDKPSDQYRVCVVLTENRYGTADAFTQATVSIYGDEFAI